MDGKYTTYSAEFKTAKLEEFLKSGKSQTAFCKENDIKLSTFRRWLGKVSNDPDGKKSSDMTLIEVTDRIKDAMSVVRLEKKTVSFSVNGFRIEVDTEDLGAFVRSMRNA